MKQVILGLLLGPLLAAAPLHVAGVVRSGMPPYEEKDRLYRLEGDGCQILRVAEYLTLIRPGDRRQLGRLQVVAVKDGYALARLATPGETYLLKGDLAVRHEMAASLPSLPGGLPDPLLRASGELLPRAMKLAVPASPSSVQGHQEPVFFLKGNAELSPAALVKLRDWVASWGVEGRWVLGLPEDVQGSTALSQARIEALKKALGTLGVTQVEVRSDSHPPVSRFDSIHVIKEPW